MYTHTQHTHTHTTHTHTHDTHTHTNACGQREAVLVAGFGFGFQRHLDNLHPIPITTFRSFQTQPLENLSAAVKLPIKQRFLDNPTLGKSLVRENIVMGTELGVSVYLSGP